MTTRPLTQSTEQGRVISRSSDFRVYDGKLRLIIVFEIVEVIVVIRQRAINQFKKGHWRRIARTESTLQDSSVTAWPVLIARSNLAEELAHGCLVTHSGKGKTTIGDRVFFRQCDQRLGNTFEFLCPGPCDAGPESAPRYDM